MTENNKLAYLGSCTDLFVFFLSRVGQNVLHELERRASEAEKLLVADVRPQRLENRLHLEAQTFE